MNKYQEALDEIKNSRIHQGLHDLLHIGKLLKKQTDILQELIDLKNEEIIRDREYEIYLDSDGEIR